MTAAGNISSHATMHQSGRLTSDPKSVCEASAAFASSMLPGRGGLLITRASLPLNSLALCFSASVPVGSPRRSLKISRRVSLTATDLRTKGTTVLFMRALTVEG